MLLIFACTLQASAITLAQTITLKKSDIKLTFLLKEIQKQSGYNIFYDSSLVPDYLKVNVDFVNQSLGNALNTVLDKYDISYEIVDKNIILNRKVSENNTIKNHLSSVKLQQKVIHGNVRELNAEGLSNVSIREKGTSNSSVSDDNGNYQIEVSTSDAILVFSYVGYEKQEIEIKDKTEVNVFLLPLMAEIDEVVVVGYGTQKRTNLTGAVSAIDMDEVRGVRPISTIGSLIQGAAPGFEVSVGSGEPGAGSSWNIRGGTSIPAGGSGNNMSSSGPLIVIDNVPINNPTNLLNPNDIETITVLKDAASAAIYGARSGFGVILITTKKGKKNQKSKFNYTNNFTVSSPMSLPEKASVLQTIQSYVDMGSATYFTGQNSETWLALVNDYNANPRNYPDGYIIDNDIRYQLAETDAFSNLFHDDAYQYQQNLSLSGGSDKTTYRISFGTVNENGILSAKEKKDYYKRYNLKSVITSDITPWFNAQLDMSYYNSSKAYPKADGLGLAPRLPSYVPMDDSLSINNEQFANGTPKNRILQTASSLDRYDDMRMTGRMIFTPITDLTITGEYTFDNLRKLNTYYDNKITFVDPQRFEVNESGTALFRKRNELTDYRAINIYANYQKTVNDHNFSLMGGFSQEESYFESEMVQRTLMINDELPSITQGVGPIEGDDGYSEYSIRGFFGRFNYDYKGKYLFEINGRFDASSKFPEGHRSVFFPSLSAGWRITEETFMENIKPVLNEFKLRGSFGTVGNQNISPYQFVPGMTASYASWLSGGELVTTLAQPGLISSDFTWATVQTLDFGVDFGLLNNKLSGSLDWYSRDTKDMLYKGIQLPAVLGTGAPLRNVAALNSTGFEIEINWRSNINKVAYNIGINFYDYQSKITKIQNEVGLLSQFYEGQKLGELWGYTSDRLYNVDDFEEGSLRSDLTSGILKPGIPKVEGSNPNPGDVLYKDFNGDGIINAGSSTLSDPGDRSIIGNESLRMQFGVRGGVSWNNFDLSFLMTGVGKNDQWRQNSLKFPNGDAFGAMYSHQLDYWTPAHSNSYFGRIYDQAGGNQKFNQLVQTKYLYNGAYLRMKNITLSYNITSNILEKFYLERFQIFCSVENAFSIDHLPKGIEADIVKDGSSGFGYPFMRKTSVGVNLSF